MNPIYSSPSIQSMRGNNAPKTRPGKFDIIADIPAYENLDIIKRFYYHNMKGTSPTARDYAGEKGEKGEISRARLTR